MPRRVLSGTPEAPTKPVQTPTLTTFSGKLQVITPIYGGGAEPALSQVEDLIRVPSIRGQLRFWWRALYGPRFKSVEEMRKAELELWGGIAKNPESQNPDDKGPVESKVKLWVSGEDGEEIQTQKSEVVPKGSKEFHKERLSDKNVILFDDAIGYVLFPENDKILPEFYKDKETKKKIKLEENIEVNDARFKQQYFLPSFILHIKCPTAKLVQVCHALRAWVTFGGLGARTRRGMGQLIWKEPPTLVPEAAEGQSYWRPANSERKTLEGWLKAVHAATASPEGAGRIPREPWLYESEIWLNPPERQYPLHALACLVDIYKKFRQARPGLGRSYWPEPDKIRHIQGTYLVRTNPVKTHTPRFNKVNYYPRGQFGLPILFHFKEAEKDTKHDGKHKKKHDDKTDIRHYDPADCELVWSDSANGAVGSQRWASPMLFFVVSLGQNFVGGVLRLNSPRPAFFGFKGATLTDSAPSNMVCHTSEQPEAMEIYQEAVKTNVIGTTHSANPGTAVTGDVVHEFLSKNKLTKIT